MRRHRYSSAAAVLAIVAVTSACASTSDRAATDAINSLRSETTTSSTTTPTTTNPPAQCDDPTASYRPQGPLPPPGQMPAGTYMRTIQDRGRLKVGVDENTLFFSYLDPLSGGFKGFEIDLAHELARAIFGNPDAIEFIPVVTKQKVPFVKKGLVDATISVVSMTCDRWRDAAFSSVYYEAYQQILVRKDSTVHGKADLPGKRVCVTRGSSSEKYLNDKIPEAKPRPVETRTDCLVALQEGRVDAVLLPSSILAGLEAQDPTTTLLPEHLQTQPYGIPIALNHPEFVVFVNTLLERWRADGTLARLELQLPENMRTVPPAPKYRD